MEMSAIKIRTFRTRREARKAAKEVDFCERPHAARIFQPNTPHANVEGYVWVAMVGWECVHTMYLREDGCIR